MIVSECIFARYVYDDCDEEESEKNYDYCEGRDDEKVTYNKKTDVIGEGHYFFLDLKYYSNFFLIAFYNF